MNRFQAPKQQFRFNKVVPNKSLNINNNNDDRINKNSDSSSNGLNIPINNFNQNCNDQNLSENTKRKIDSNNLSQINKNDLKNDSMINLENKKQRINEGNSTNYNKTQQNDSDKSYLHILNELTVYHNLKVKYEVVNESGPQHAKIFQVKCSISNPKNNDSIIEEYFSTGTSINRAKQSVAEIALNQTALERPSIDQMKKRRSEVYQEKLDQNLINFNHSKNINSIIDENSQKDYVNINLSNSNMPSPVSYQDTRNQNNKSNQEFSIKPIESHSNLFGSQASLVSLMSINIDPSKLSINLSEDVHDKNLKVSNKVFHNTNSQKNINNNKNNNNNRKNGKFDYKEKKKFESKKSELIAKKEIKPNSAAAAALAIANLSNTITDSTNKNANKTQETNNINSTSSQNPAPVPPPNYNLYSNLKSPINSLQQNQKPLNNSSTSTYPVPNIPNGASPMPGFSSSTTVPTFPGYPASGYDPYSVAYSNYYAQWQAQYFQQWQWASMNQTYAANNSSTAVQPPPPPPPPPK